MERRSPGLHCCDSLLPLLVKPCLGAVYFRPKHLPLKLMPVLQLCCLLCLKPHPAAVCGSPKYLLLSAGCEFLPIVSIRKRLQLRWLCSQLSSQRRAPLAGGHGKRAPLAAELLCCCLGCCWLGWLHRWLSCLCWCWCRRELQGELGLVSGRDLHVHHKRGHVHDHGRVLRTCEVSGIVGLELGWASGSWS